jgi:hypothetical protein
VRDLGENRSRTTIDYRSENVLPTYSYTPLSLLRDGEIRVYEYVYEYGNCNSVAYGRARPAPGAAGLSSGSTPVIFLPRFFCQPGRVATPIHGRPEFEGTIR